MFNKAHRSVAVLVGGFILSAFWPGAVFCGPKLHVVFVGASIGKAWDLDEYPIRSGHSDLVVEFLDSYRFDKSELISTLTERDVASRPHYIVIKECAAYFPGKLDAYKEAVASWAGAIRLAGIEPVLATVVPVTEWRAHHEGLGPVGKMRIWARDTLKYGGQSQIEGIRAYNGWVRTYAGKNGIPVFDLAGALAAGEGGYLTDSYAADDGLHLNRSGYERLDDALGTFLLQLEHNEVD